MRIYVRILTGYTVLCRGHRELEERCLSLEADKNDTVLTVKAILQQMIHVTPNAQQLYFRVCSWRTSPP
jgi:hypothetical protein